jgi:DNA-binding CsgD family transcriptional regulator
VGPETYVGRDAEITVLRQLVRDLADGRGGIVLVEGEPGIGKSSLLTAGLSEAGQVGAATAWAAGDQLSQRFPLRVMLNALGIESRSPDPRRAEIAAVLRGDPGRTGWSDDPVGSTTETLIALVERLCATQPLILVIDDLHWADEPSLVMWRRLARLVEQIPLLLAGATRGVPRSAELDRLVREVSARDGVLPLAPLDRPEVELYLTALIGTMPGKGLSDLVDRAAGNPLFVREVVDAVRDGLVVRGGVAELAGRDDQRVPTSLASAVAGRLSFLSPGTVQTLQLAALLGGEFAVTDLVAVLGRAAVDVVPDVEEALSAGIVVDTGGDRLAFRHPLVRQSLYEAIPATVRTSLHRQAARALAEAGAPTRAVAEQLVSVPGGLDEWVLGWLDEALPSLVNLSLEVAVDLLRLGVEHTAPEHPRWEPLATALAQSMFRYAQGDDGEEVAQRVLARTLVPDQAARMREMLATTMSRTDRGEQALALIRDGLATPGMSDRWRARLHAQHALTLLIMVGDLDGAEAAAQEAYDLGSRVGDPYATGSALLWLAGISSHRGDTSTLLANLDKGLAVVGDDPESLHIRLVTLYNRVSVLDQLDRLDEAQQTMAAVRQIAERAGGGTLHRLGQVAAGLAYSTGRWDDALAEADTVTDLSSPDLALHVCGVVALIAGRRDERAAAEEALKNVEHLSMAVPIVRNNARLVYAGRALLAEQDGRSGDAVAILSTVLEPDHAVMDDRFKLLPDLVRLALHTGDLAAARAASQTCAADAERSGTPGARLAAQRCAGLLDGDPEPVLACAEHYQAVGRRADLGQAWEDAATVLAATGRDADARQALDQALQVYTDLSAVWDARRAEARLRPFGVRRGVRGPRKRPSRGWDALSPTELTITRLVAQGLSNPDIATQLLLSRRTVQTHVSHILAKLDARSRVEIARQAMARLADLVPAEKGIRTGRRPG